MHQGPDAVSVVRCNGSGPGGASVFSDATGRYLVYHVWRGTPTATTAGSYRAAVISPLPSADAQIVTVRAAGGCASSSCPQTLTRVSVEESAGTTVGVASAMGGTRSWAVTTAGHVVGLTGTTSLGSAASIRLNQPIVGMAATPTGQRLLAGRLRRRHLHLRRRQLLRLHRRHPPQPTHRRHGRHPRPATATGWSPPTAASSPSATPHFYGSTGGIHLNQPIVGMAATPDRPRLLARRLRRRHLHLRRRRLLRLHRRHPPQPAHRRHGRHPRPATATGSSPPTAASSPSATPASTAPQPRSPIPKGSLCRKLRHVDEH